MPLQGQFTTPEFNIDYDESPWQTQSIGEAVQTASRRLQVKGHQVWQFLQEVLGWSQMDFGGFKLERHPPWTHPRFEWMNARSAQFVRECGPHQLEGPQNNRFSFEVEEWEFVYQTDEDKLVKWLPDHQRPANVEGEAWRYVSRRLDLSMTVQTLTTGALKYNKLEDGKNKAVPDGQTGQLIQSGTLTLVWYQIPIVFDANGAPQFPGRLAETIAETVACMNSDEFEGYAPQTLLLLDPKYTLKWMSNGKPAIDITYTMSVRGSDDVSGVALYETDTDTSDFTRILRASGKFGRVYRADDPAKVRSIHEPRPFNRLFTFV